MKFEVIVGNIGTVYAGTDQDKAEADYAEYVRLSKASYGRAAGEDVTLIADGEISREYQGEVR